MSSYGTFEKLVDTSWSRWRHPNAKINHPPVDEDDARELKSYLERLLDEASDSRQEYMAITEELLEKYSGYIDIPGDECDQFQNALSKVFENYADIYAISEHAQDYLYYGRDRAHLTEHVGDDRWKLFWFGHQLLQEHILIEQSSMVNIVRAALRGYTIFEDDFKGLTDLSAEDCRLEEVTKIISLKDALEKQKAESVRASTEALSLKKALEIEKAESALASAEILSLKEALEKQKAETAQASTEALGLRKALEIIGSAQASAENLSLKQAIENQKAESALASQESADMYSAEIMDLRRSNTTLQSNNTYLTTRVEQLAHSQEEAMQAKAEKQTLLDQMAELGL